MWISCSLQSLDGRPPYPYVDDELRKVARDAYVSWQGSRYSVPWQYAGRSVWVRERDRNVEVHYGGSGSQAHEPERASTWWSRSNRSITLEFHWAAPAEHKILIHIRNTAPVVEVRPLAAYENAALGGGR